MIFILSKILLFLIKPTVWIFALILFAFLTKNRSKKKKIYLLALIIAVIFSNVFLAGKVANWYEADYPASQKYDIGLVLGGFSSINPLTHQIAFNWASDRLFQTLLLYKKGIIKKILISGGNSNLINKKVKEANLVIDYLKLIGIPDSAILLENQSRNTIENARNSIALIKSQNTDAKILVITSAWHIPRAKLIFDRQTHSKIEYYPTNFIGKTDYDIGDFIIPDIGTFGTWELLFKEWIGLAIDRFRN